MNEIVQTLGHRKLLVFNAGTKGKLRNAANSSSAQRNMFTDSGGNSVMDSDILESAHSSK